MSNTVWELDFYSRPILDENDKKLWEVLICESPNDIERSPDTLFKYAQYCSSSSVNSLWLKEAIENAIAKAETSPKKIRFPFPFLSCSKWHTDRLLKMQTVLS